MGLFDMFKKETTNNDGVNRDTQSADLATRVNLSKEEVKKVCLKKNLIGTKAKVALVLDISGSMSHAYKSGEVQRIVEKCVPIAMEFDDDGRMECFIFNTTCKRLEDVTLENLDGYVRRETRNNAYGGTKYAPAIYDVCDVYRSNHVPSYVIFITDGDNWDKEETEKVIKDASYKPIFWQFIGVGNEDFGFLKKLDDMTGRFVDNADFFKVESLSDITYDKMLDEFPKWLKNDKVKGLIK